MATIVPTGQSVRDGGQVACLYDTQEPSTSIRLNGRSLSSTTATLWTFVLALAIRLIFVFVARNNTTDAWARLQCAVLWLQHPLQLPPATSGAAWLPLHFWLLGTVLWMTKSPWMTRALSALLGATTVVILFALVSQSFSRRAAVISAVLFTCFGFHIAFSVTTSSEAPTIFFIALGLYMWVRYFSERTPRWLLASAVSFSVASLIRFEVWLCAPVLSVMLLDFSGGWKSAWSNRRAWKHALSFGFLASAGSTGWLLFSFLKWGDALHLPHQTMWLNLHFQPVHHSMMFRLLAVPGALLISLSPLVVGLACIGLAQVIMNGSLAARTIAILVCVLCALNIWNSVRYEISQARYTLLYSWLLFPLALEGLLWLSSRSKLSMPQMTIATVAFFLTWQMGIIAGSRYAPPAIADRLGALSPTVPLRHEMRQLTQWLIANESQYHAIVIDDFNWESPEIFRFARLYQSIAFGITQEDYDNPTKLKRKLDVFLQTTHPDLLVCSPDGPIGKLLALDVNNVQFEGARFRLDPLWRGEHWRVYRMTYL
jgi:hypothetical protein